MWRLNVAAVVCLGWCCQHAAAVELTLTQFATGLTQPVVLTHAGDSRMFVVERLGTIRIVDGGGNVNPTPFMDISGRVEAGGEGGLLGLAFHPFYSVNGYFFVCYTGTGGGVVRISRFSVTANPDVADPASEQVILTLGHYDYYHYGGWIGFGPDGFLYISRGDGRQRNAAQETNTIQGKILRIDVDSSPGGTAPDCLGTGTGAYLVPSTNPFVDGPGGACDELWSLGLRNPWRASFDRLTGELWIGDVGETSVEEVDLQARPGENYGWCCYEGSSVGPGCGSICGPPASYEFPLFEYAHSDGCAVAGGYVYRGSLALLNGIYVATDYCSGYFWLAENAGGSWTVTEQTNLAQTGLAAFGENASGDLFALNVDTGTIEQIGATCSSITVMPPSPLPHGTVGLNYGVTISASGGSAPYTFAVTAGALPVGLSLDTNTGLLSGIPTMLGLSTFTITATGSRGCSGSEAYTLLICPTITVGPPTLPNGRVGALYSQNLSASGGTAPYTFSVTAGALPPGLSLDANTGLLAGTPTAQGPSTFTVTATDAGGCEGSASYALTIDCPFITLSPATIPGGEVGSPYNQSLTASGGTAPYSYTITAGALPPGLSLDPSAGTLAGTPVGAGTFAFTVTATDATLCTGSHAYVMTIDCAPVSLGPASLPDGHEGLAYDVSFTATGGIPPYTFGLVSGVLPAGLTLDPSTGELAGIPTAAGVYPFEITATDAAGCTSALRTSRGSATGRAALTITVHAAVDYLVGEGLGDANTNMVKLYNREGAPTSVAFQAYGAGKWGTNVAAGDVDGLPYEELLTGPGPGTVYGPQVRGFSRVGVPVAKVSFFAYGTLKYGVNVAAGSIDGDVYHEILTGPGPGAVFGPHVRGWNYDGTVLTPIAKVSFFAYGTLKYGVNVAAGDVEADGYGEILGGPGPGSVFGPQVRAWNVDGGAVSSINKINFDAFSGMRYGANVDGGDVDGDVFDELVATPGPGPLNPSRFRGYDYDGALVAPTPGFDLAVFATLYGGRVGLGDLLANGRSDLLAGAGRDPAALATTLAYDYDAGALTPVPGSGFNPFPLSAFGVNPAGAGAGHY